LRADLIGLHAKSPAESPKSMLASVRVPTTAIRLATVLSMEVRTIRGQGSDGP
jgi:hypothetical protein